MHDPTEYLKESYDEGYAKGFEWGGFLSLCDPECECGIADVVHEECTRETESEKEFYFKKGYRKGIEDLGCFIDFKAEEDL